MPLVVHVIHTAIQADEEFKATAGLCATVPMSLLMAVHCVLMRDSRLTVMQLSIMGYFYDTLNRAVIMRWILFSR